MLITTSSVETYKRTFILLLRHVVQPVLVRRLIAFLSL